MKFTLQLVLCTFLFIQIQGSYAVHQKQKKESHNLR
jgi:hypothetical protein